MRDMKHFILIVMAVAFVPEVAAQVTLEIKQQEKTTFTTRTDIKVAQTLQLAGQEIAGALK